MKKTNIIGPVVLAACLSLACSDDALKSGGSGGSATGGQGAAGSVAGAVGSGGAATGGVASSTGGGGAGGVGAGGKAAGGTAGKSATGGSGGTGTTCLPSGACTNLYCPNGYVPNPSDPCGCPVCAPADGGPGKDAGVDACLALPCAPPPQCPAGYSLVSPPCGCASCVPVDAGTIDAIVCPASCPAARCAYGTVRDACGCPVCVPPDAGYPDTVVCPPIACPNLACVGRLISDPANPCGCPVCEPADAGPDTGKVDCVGLDECACGSTQGCSVIADACYCPFPKCQQGGACVCGGGKFLGCAPAALSTCATAKARVADMCPTLSGATFDNLCQGSDSACVTSCLNQVTACSNIACSTCETCDCAGDAFSACRAKCGSATAQ